MKGDIQRKSSFKRGKQDVLLQIVYHYSRGNRKLQAFPNVNYRWRTFYCAKQQKTCTKHMGKINIKTL